MAFLTNPQNINEYRNTLYNGNAVVTKFGIDRIVGSFDDIFDSFKNFTAQISRLMMFPIKIPKAGGVEKVLQTALGKWDGSLVPADKVPAWDIDNRYSYMNIGQSFIEPHFNDFADYSGYTQISVFLPLLGFVNIDTNEVMGKWLQIRLNVDFYTGEGTYILGVTDNEIANYESYNYGDVDRDNSYNMRIIGNYNTTIGIEIPTGSSNAGDIQRNLLLGGVKLATALYTGISLTLPSATIAAYTPPSPIPSQAMYSNLPVPTNALSTPRPKTTYSVASNMGNISINKRDIGDAFVNSVEAASRIRTVGNTDRADSPLQMFPLSTTAKVIYYRPKFVPLDSGYNHLYGKPLGRVETLKDIHGYTEVSRIHFEGTQFGSCTSEEYSMIESAFSNGVILP